MNHLGTRRLETERLILRRAEIGDAKAMYENWTSDPEVAKYMTWPPHASVEVTAQLLNYWLAGYEQPDNYNWLLELKRTGEPIGSLSVTRINEGVGEAELGWCMGRSWWGKGLMPEAANEALRFLLDEVGFNRVAARHDVNNPKSGRVMQKIGMRYEGTLRQAGRNNQGLVDEVCYAMLKSDFMNGDFRFRAGQS